MITAELSNATDCLGCQKVPVLQTEIVIGGLSPATDQGVWKIEAYNDIWN
jgi:hypothetical protein